jgi:two-component system, OmpR family, sensor histidine kinase VicK
MAKGNNGQHYELPFLKGGGEMGELTRSFNWSASKLGEPGQWPAALKILISTILNSAFPQVIMWGDELVTFYNDPYRRSLGLHGKHPAVGKPAKEVWADEWPVVGSLIEKVITSGDSVWFEDQSVPSVRDGVMQDVFWTFSYSPAIDENGKIWGLHVICQETTAKVLAIKQLEENHRDLKISVGAQQLAEKKIRENERNLRLIIQQAPVAVAIFRGPDYVTETVNARALELWNRKYSDVLNKPIMEALPELKDQGVQELLDHVYQTGETFSATEMPVQLFRNGQIETAYLNFVYEAVYDEHRKINALITIGFEVTKQVLARKVIEESEQRFRTMAESTDVLIAVGDEEGKATYFNKAWTELTNRTIEELIDTWLSLVHPDDREKMIKGSQMAFDKREPFRSEFRLLAKDGDYRWLLNQAQPRFHSDGEFTGFISSCVDITARKLNEIEMQKYLAVIEASYEFIGTATLDGRAQYMNKFAMQRLGWDTWEGKTIMDCVYPEDRDYAGAILNERMEKGASRQEIRFWNATTGEPFWIEWNGLTLRNPNSGDIMGLATVSPDITERKRFQQELQGMNEEMASANEELGAANEELVTTNEELAEAQENMQELLSRLSESEAKLLQAIDTGNMGPWSINPATMEVSMSRFIRELYGFNLDGPVEMEEIMRAVHPDYHEPLTNVLGNALEKHLSSDIEYPINNLKTGERRWVRATGKVFEDADGNATEYSGLVMDITERKLDELRKNDFIGMVSHELKTPLTTLSALVQVLGMKLKDMPDAFISGAMDKAGVQVKKMTNMINGFLNISRLESGKILIVKHVFDLNELIEEMIAETKLTVSSHNISFNGTGEIDVNADRDKIGSVISNLLSNSVKYSPKGKNIEVTCKKIGGYAQVSVKDEGMGIKPQDLEKLFDRYYRVETKHTAHISGFGIGLYLSAEIINRHDGKIWAESESGSGSIFYFTLPL